ncbi:LysR family transcriptional regulator, partial [Burkholderia pseudomallei]|nr:LysR family transcriptional regulator [Burkholderia pseudomallei]
ISPVTYAFQWSGGELRGLIPSMLALVRRHADFR